MQGSTGQQHRGRPGPGHRFWGTLVGVGAAGSQPVLPRPDPALPLLTLHRKPQVVNNYVPEPRTASSRHHAAASSEHLPCAGSCEGLWAFPTARKAGFSVPFLG